MPLARAVLAPVPSSPRAPEPPWAVPSHGARWRRAVPGSGQAPRGRARHDLAEREEREHEDDDAEDEHERAPPSAPGGGAVELPLFTGRAGGGPVRPSPSRPVNPRHVASLRPRAAFGPRRTAVARKPSARLGLTRISCVPRGAAARGRPLRPPGPARPARPPNKLRRPRRQRSVAKARTRKRAFASTKAWPRLPRASSGRRARRHCARRRRGQSRRVTGRCPRASRARPAPRTRTRTTGTGSGAQSAPPWPAGRAASRAFGRCAARFASPGPAPVLGLTSSIGEMASHLPAGETTSGTGKRAGRARERAPPFPL